MSTELLARLQFGFTVAFHYLFPPLSIGLGLILVIMETKWLRSGNDLYKRMTHFWVKIFALIFGIGVASGIVLEFEFGTNWATYSRYVGDIFGSALAAEGIFAFFLESGFLAVLVFGWDRVSPKFHLFSTIMVWLGSTFSAVWIVVANSWMQTPAGYKIVQTPMGERAHITDFWAMVLNPSSIERLTHVIISAWMTAAFLVTSVSAYYLLKKKHIEFAKSSMKIGLIVALVSSLLQFVAGHQSVLVVAEHQPSKMAAMEGHFDSNKPLDLTLFGWIDEANNRTVGLGIPGGGSFLLSGDFNKRVTGLDQIQDRPPLQMTFQTYHVMIALGSLMALIAVVATYQWWRRTLWECTWMLKVLVVAVVLPQIATQAGWWAAEIGRQPWIVYGMLRTKDGISKAVTSEQIVISLILFTIVYTLLFLLFLYLMDRKIKQGPDGEDHPDDPELMMLPPDLGGRKDKQEKAPA